MAWVIIKLGREAVEAGDQVLEATMVRWREQPRHWLHRVDEVVLSVAEEFAIEYLESVEEYGEEDGTPYDSRGPDEIVQESLESQNAWIEARLSGLDSRMLAMSRSEALAEVGHAWRMDDWLDIALTRTFLDGLEEMRERLVNVPAIVFSSEVPEEIRVYVVQATKSFVHDLREAAGVLARLIERYPLYSELSAATV